MLTVKLDNSWLETIPKPFQIQYLWNQVLYSFSSLESWMTYFVPAYKMKMAERLQLPRCFLVIPKGCLQELCTKTCRWARTEVKPFRDNGMLSTGRAELVTSCFTYVAGESTYIQSLLNFSCFKSFFSPKFNWMVSMPPGTTFESGKYAVVSFQSILRLQRCFSILI